MSRDGDRRRHHRISASSSGLVEFVRLTRDHSRRVHRNRQDLGPVVRDRVRGIPGWKWRTITDSPFRKR
jgi:hypothetical protein